MIEFQFGRMELLQGGGERLPRGLPGAYVAGASGSFLGGGTVQGEDGQHLQVNLGFRQKQPTQIGAPRFATGYELGQETTSCCFYLKNKGQVSGVGK